MAEAVVMVCDQCGKQGASSVTIRVGARSFVKDLCEEHLRALLKDTRAPRRGRPRTGASPSSIAAPKKRIRRSPRKKAARAATRQKATRTKSRKRAPKAPR